MTDDIGTIIEDQFKRLLDQHLAAGFRASAEGAPLSQPLWAAVEEAGLTLALVPESAGGIGLAPVAAFDLIALASQHAAPMPMGESIAVAGLLGRPVEGPSGLGVMSDGKMASIAWGGDVTQVLCAETGQRAWRLVPVTGVAADHARNLAGERRDTLKISARGGEEIAAPNWLDADDLLAVGALVRAAQMCGAMRRAVDLSVAHAVEREQFGRPIAKFQAVQHMLSDAASQLAAATALMHNAAEAWGSTDFAFRAALAKIRAGAAAGLVAEVAHQVHAAMGFTREYELHHYTRRLWSWRDEFGSEAYWQRIVGEKVCAEGGDALWSTLVEATSGAAA